MGRLQIEPGVPPKLEAFGTLVRTSREVPGAAAGFTASVEIDPWTLVPVTIQGDLFQANQRVSLMQSRLAGYTRRFGGRVADPGTQRFESSIAFVGTHATDLSEMRFSGIRLRMNHLDDWASLPGLEWQPRNRETDRDQISHRFLEMPSCDLAEGGKIDFDPTTTITPPSATGAAIFRACFLRLRLANALTWPEIDLRIITPLRSLFALAVGQRCDPIQVDVHGEDERLIGVISQGIKAPTGMAVGPHDMLAPLGILKLEHIARWLKQAELLGPLPPVVADSVAGSSRMLETEVLDLATVAEGLHRRLFPDAFTMGEEDEKAATELAGNAVAKMSEAVQQAVKSSLLHLTDLSYPKRLAKLAELAEMGAPGITGRSNRWKRSVADTRNTFAHRSAPGFLQDENIDEYVAVMISLEWVLRVVLLLQSGIEASTLSERISAHEPFRLFLEQAEGWLPNVYLPDPPAEAQASPDAEGGKGQG